MSDHHHWYCLGVGPCECASRPCCCDGCPRDEVSENGCPAPSAEQDRTASGSSATDGPP